MSSSQTSSSNSEPNAGVDQPSIPPELVASSTGARARLDGLLRRFGNVRLDISCDVGHTTMRLRALLALKAGSIVEVERPVGDDLGLRMNGVLLGRADVMVVESSVLLRITEINDAN